MAIILITKEDLVKLLEEEIDAWDNIGGGPNLNAFAFEPENIDPAHLRDLGYYKNRDSWIAGVRIKKVKEYLETIKEALPGSRH
mgnify:CR=1 FL=1